MLTDKQSIQAVQSYDEWSQLEEVIIGTVEGFNGLQLDSSFNLFCWDNIKTYLIKHDYLREQSSWPIVNIEHWIIDELKEDLSEFVSTLQLLGVKVVRPHGVVGNTTISTPYWNSNQCVPLNVRDQTVILGNTIIETSSHVRARYFENDYLKPLFMEYFIAGSSWLCMPKPTLAKGTIDRSFHHITKEEEFAVTDRYEEELPSLGIEMIFDGAQCIRLGRDVLVNVANRNHYLAYEWLYRHMGSKFKFHLIDGMSDNHIDSIILPLRPGVWLIRDIRYKQYLPELAQRWQFIEVPESNEDLFPSYDSIELSIASKFIDMNVLSVNENTVIVNSLFPELMNTLESEGFTVVPVRHRHRRLFGGGFHCFSLDVRRQGALESYL